MLTRTGAYLTEQRRAKRLTRGQLAAAIGYTNIAKGARRLQALEREGRTVEGLLENVVRVLGLDPEHVKQLVNEDSRRFRAEWEAWCNEPVEPVLRFRPFAGLWCGESLPKGLSRSEAIAYARSRAVERITYVLVWNRREEVWCYPSGETYERLMNVGEVAGPFTWLRGHRNRGFIFG